MEISKRAKIQSDKPLYKEKKKTDKGYVWVYDEKTIEKRWKEKKDKIKKLQKGIEKLRKKYEKDLSSDDLRTKALAAVVAIMDETAMRIGNEDSARDAKTYGASTLKVKHLTFSGNKAKIKYVGKGGVDQDTEVSGKKLISTLKELVKGKKDNDFVFEIDGTKIWDRAVNRYLNPFNISAKDLRGFHSNRLMKEQLKTKDWKEALDEVAELVGHKPATLKNQYLDPELVEKYENKKEAGISIRADQLTTAPMSQTVENLKQPIMSDPDFYAKQNIDINKNVPNIAPGAKMTPVLQQAWRIIAPFLPPGSKLTSGFRDDYDQIRIILENWLSWTPSGDYKKNQGFFHKSDPKSKNIEGLLRNILYRAKQGLDGQDIKFSPRELKVVENLRQKMTGYQGPERLDIAPVGESWHLMGSALDIVGNFGRIAKAIQYLQKNYSHMLPIRFHTYEPGNKAYHVEIGGQITMPPAEEFAEMLLAYEKMNPRKPTLTKRQSLLISKRALLRPQHVKEIEQMRQQQISTLPVSKRDTQSGNFGEQLTNLKVKVPADKLNREILSAWYSIQQSGLLPENAWMTSAVRTPEDQARVISNYWKSSGASSAYPQVADPVQMANILRRMGYSINNPEDTPHSSGRSFDISGANLSEIADAINRVSRQTGILMKPLIEEQNNAVHVDILGRQTVSSVIIEEDEDYAEDEVDMDSIYEDILASDAPKEILEAFRPEEQEADDEPNKYEREKDDPKWKKALLKDWTREEIRNHYAKNADKILKEIKGEPVMLYIGTDKDKNILKRKHNDKPIVMANKEDLLYWADRRLLSIHRIFGPKTKLGFVDLDVHGDFPKEKAKEYAKDIAEKIKDKYSSSPTIYESGGSGYHIEFDLKQEKDIDSLRDELHALSEELNKDYEGFTTGIVKGAGVRTDTTTLKNNGNIRVPYTIHESKGGIKQPMGSDKKAFISVRADEMLAEVEVEKPEVKLPEEQKSDIGFGKDDQMGDWFEKSPKFLERKELDVELHDINESSAGQLANTEPDTFFYRGLHKTYPKLESEALKNMLKDNAKFYFVFKYHERPEEAFKALLQPAAEALSQQDVRAFFYYHLHHNFPELGRGAIIQLVDTNPDSFFDLGLDKDYPDYVDSANNARNIKDPNKVELELDQLEQITSSMKISKRASKKKLAAEVPDIQISDKEKQIFDILLGAIKHFGLKSTIRVAGGWVRDKVMGKNSKDIDIAVDNMSGKDFAEKALAYARMQGVPAKSVGVIEARPDQSKHLETAVVNLLDESIDFVNLRAEKYDPSTRIPQVVPGTALEDAYRRDFTINALFYNINDGKVEDLTGTGVEDIKNGVIRTPIPPKEIWSQVGITDESQVINPKKTFMDDPLRILRAIRFASRYGFKLAPELMDAAKDPEVQESFRSKISRERIEAELRKMVAGPSPVWALQLIKELGLRSEVLKLPEGTKEWEMDQNNPHHQLNIWDHISETLGNLQQIVKDRNLNDADKFAVNLAAFLHDVGKLDPKIHGTKEIGGKIVSTYHGHEESSIAIAEYMLKNLPGVRTEEIERVKKLIDAARRVNPTRQESSEIANMTRKQLGNFVRMIGDDWENAIDIAMADASAKKKDWLPTYNPTYYKSLKEQIKGMGLEKAHTMKPLLTGDELMKLFGRKGGKWVGVLNKELIQWQLENPTATKDDAIASAKQLYQQMDLAKSADFLISKRAVQPTMEFKKEYTDELSPFDPSKYKGPKIEPIDSEEFGVRHIEDEELPPEMIVRPSLTDAEVLEQIKRDPTVFISYSDFAKRFPHLERTAIEEIAKRFPEVYFISNLQNNPTYQDLDEVALNNLLVSRPKLYFTMGLFDSKQFATKLGEAMQSVATRDPQFFLEVLLPLERFKDFRSLEEVAKESLKKSRAALISKRAGVVDYPKQMHDNIMEWVKVALPGTAFADMEKRRVKPTSALRLAPVVIGDAIKEDKNHWANEFKEYTTSQIRLKKLILTAIESVNKQYRAIERDNWKQELDISTEDGNITIIENSPEKMVLNINTLAPTLVVNRNENGNIDVKGDVGNSFFSSRMEYNKQTDALTFDFIDTDWIETQDSKLEKFVRSNEIGEFYLGEPHTKPFVINKLNDMGSKDSIVSIGKTSDQYAYMISRSVAAAIAFEDSTKATLASHLANLTPHVIGQESIIFEIDVSDTKQYPIIAPKLIQLQKNEKFKEVSISLSRESSKQANSAGNYNNNNGKPIIKIIGNLHRLVNFLQEQSNRNNDKDTMKYMEEDFKDLLYREIKAISETVKHELVHMMQEIMRSAISEQKGKDIGMAGLPTYYNPNTLQLYKNKEQYTGPAHTLSDIEFYANLQDEFANMRRDVISPSLSRPEIDALTYFKKPLHIRDMELNALQKNRPDAYKYVMEQRFREFILQNRRLKTLKEHKPQYYEKMVRELYRELNKLITTSMSDLASISKRAKPKKHAKAGIFAVVPGDLAKGFPSLGDHDDSKPHITVLFIGEVPKKHEGLLEETVKDIVSSYEPFEVKLDEKVSYFPASKHSDGCKIAKLKVISKDLHKFHDTLKDGISDAGIEIDDHFPDYKPHVTLEYMEPGKEKYDSDAPSGSWTIESVEIWNGDHRKRFRLGGKNISKRADSLGQKTDKDYVEQNPYEFFHGGWADEKDFEYLIPAAAKKIVEEDAVPYAYFDMDIHERPNLNDVTKLAIEKLLRLDPYAFFQYKLYEKFKNYTESAIFNLAQNKQIDKIIELSKIPEFSISTNNVFDNMSPKDYFFDGIHNIDKSIERIREKTREFFNDKNKLYYYFTKFKLHQNPIFINDMELSDITSRALEVLIMEYPQYYHEITIPKGLENIAEKLKNKILLEQRLVDNKSTPERPKDAKERARRLGDRFYIHTIGGKRGENPPTKLIIDRLINIDKILGEISVSDFNSSKKLLSQGPTGIAALFYGQASHFFPYDAASGLNPKNNLLEAGKREERLKQENIPYGPEASGAHNEAFFNPSMKGNRLVGFVVIGSKEDKNFNQYTKIADKLADIKGVENVSLEGSMHEPTKTRQEWLEVETPRQMNTRKRQERQQRREVPLSSMPEESATHQLYTNLISPISKRAGELIHIKGMPFDLVEKLNQLPSDDSTPSARSDFYRANGNLYIKGPDLEHNITIGWRFANYYALPVEFRDMAAAHTGYGARVFVAYGPDAHDTIFKYDGKDGDEVFNKLKDFLTGPMLGQIKDKVVELVKKDTNVVELPKKGSISVRAKDPLSKYKKMRDFKETPEPEGKVESGKNKYRFVIQKHDADTAGLHFDLRLENDDGAMTSFAIPKHKLPTGKERLFAQQTEDHPIEYNKFKGEIEEGYGKGHVDIHDSGTYELVKWDKDTIKFRLKGKKETGSYTLHKTDGKKWMIMVMKDE